jgi:glutamate-ammonia-ligase adenylyltransferase
VHDTFWVTDAYGNQISDPLRIHELRVAAVLIKQFTHLLPRSPNPAQALRQFGALTGQMLSRPEWVSDLQSLQSGAVLGTIAELMGVSQFLWEDFLRMQHENLFPVLRDVPALGEAKSKGRLRDELTRELIGSEDEDAQQRARRLNQFKDREMFRIDLRHITGRIDFVHFSRELSDLAEVVVERACVLCHAELQRQFGVPRLPDGRDCAWCICALGKFGGRELGFASDVELIFVYEAEGTTSGREPLQHSRYFEEFVSAFLRTFTARREGIFEIDLRLRPHGKAGALASSLDGFAQYFSPSGPAQQFERLALVKLRPVAGDETLGVRVLQSRDAFVYSSQPLDYQNIRHLRSRQAAELVPLGATSAKFSSGGLVDVEYFVQANQIEAGRTDASVREPNTLDAIDRLQAAGCLQPDFARELRDTYGFRRRLIDALRVVRGHARDLTIPPADSREFAYLARRLKYDSPAQLTTDIARRTLFARQLW